MKPSNKTVFGYTLLVMIMQLPVAIYAYKKGVKTETLQMEQTDELAIMALISTLAEHVDTVSQIASDKPIPEDYFNLIETIGNDVEQLVPLLEKGTISVRLRLQLSPEVAKIVAAANAKKQTLMDVWEEMKELKKVTKDQGQQFSNAHTTLLQLQTLQDFFLTSSQMHWVKKVNELVPNYVREIEKEMANSGPMLNLVRDAFGTIKPYTSLGVTGKPILNEDSIKHDRKKIEQLRYFLAMYNALKNRLFGIISAVDAIQTRKLDNDLFGSQEREYRNWWGSHKIQPKGLYEFLGMSAREGIQKSEVQMRSRVMQSGAEQKLDERALRSIRIIFDSPPAKENYDAFIQGRAVVAALADILDKIMDELSKVKTHALQMRADLESEGIQSLADQVQDYLKKIQTSN